MLENVPRDNIREPFPVSMGTSLPFSLSFVVAAFVALRCIVPVRIFSSRRRSASVSCRRFAVVTQYARHVVPKTRRSETRR